MYCISLISGRNFYLPIDLNIKYPNNLHGLFNQINQIINAMVINPDWIHDKNIKTYVDIISTDPFEGNVCPISELINLNKINEHGYNFEDVMNIGNDIILDWKKFQGPLLQYFYNPESFKEMSKKIVFSDKILNIGKSIVTDRGLENKEVNLVHLRFCSNFNKKISSIDKDSLDHESSNSLISGQICDFTQDGEEYNKMIIDCRNIIYENCSKEQPLCIIAIDKDHDFIKQLSMDYNIIYITQEEYDEYLDSIPKGSDIYGLCDVSFALNLKINNFIHQHNDESKYVSSYSLFLKNYLNYKKDFYYHLAAF